MRKVKTFPKIGDKVTIIYSDEWVKGVEEATGKVKNIIGNYIFIKTGFFKSKKIFMPSLHNWKVLK